MKQFREDMDTANISIRIYSGRGMFGKETYGVDCGRGMNGGEQDVYHNTRVRLLSDSMGMGTILYVSR